MEQVMTKIKDMVEEKLGAGYSVSVREQTKNNGAVCHGLMIAEGDAPAICPVIYVDGYLAEIKESRMTEREAADAVVSDYRSDAVRPSLGAELFRIDKQSVLDRVVYRLVNAEMNSARLSELPHRDFLDLSAEYRVVMELKGAGPASALVSRRMCKSLGIAESELDAAARLNTAKAGFVAKPMSEIIEELTGHPVSDYDEPNMAVYTNEGRSFGSTVMLYPDEFKAFAEKTGGDLFILPSSVHEVIAIPADAMQKNELRDLVGAVNKNEVTEEEVLSENVYRYSLKTGAIMIA